MDIDFSVGEQLPGHLSRFWRLDLAQSLGQSDADGRSGILH
jgi:hypothetical protein